MRQLPSALYGESIFTSMRCFQGRLLGLDYHLNRLFDAVSDYYFDHRINRSQFDSFFQIKSKIKDLSQGVSEDFYLRITIYSAKRSEILPKNFSISDLELDIELKKLNPAKFKESLAVKLCPSPFSKNYIPHKAGSYFQNFYFRSKAMKAGFDDVLFWDEESKSVLEASTSNLGILKDGKVVFPEDPRILIGISQKLLKDFFTETGFGYEVRGIKKEEVLSADALFLSNSVSLVTPIRQLDSEHFKIDEILKLKNKFEAYLLSSN